MDLINKMLIIMLLLISFNLFSSNSTEKNFNYYSSLYDAISWDEYISIKKATETVEVGEDYIIIEHEGERIVVQLVQK